MPQRCGTSTRKRAGISRAGSAPPVRPDSLQADLPLATTAAEQQRRPQQTRRTAGMAHGCEGHAKAGRHAARWAFSPCPPHVGGLGAPPRNVARARVTSPGPVRPINIARARAERYPAFAVLLAAPLMRWLIYAQLSRQLGKKPFGYQVTRVLVFPAASPRPRAAPQAGECVRRVHRGLVQAVGPPPNAATPRGASQRLARHFANALADGTPWLVPACARERRSAPSTEGAGRTSGGLSRPLRWF